VSDKFSHLNEDEYLKAENDFLKMKLMLEHGAHFGGGENNELPAGIENEFLNNMMAFEKQCEERKRIKVYDKIGGPQHFKPVGEIPDNEMDNAWEELLSYLNRYNIDLGACSPNISNKELYRFTIEELFEHEMDDMSLPGWTTNFIYDEFHPDPIYDNTRAAKDDCIKQILEKDPIEWIPHFRSENIRLNDHFPLSEDKLKSIVNDFKLAYDELKINEIVSDNCVVNGRDSIVSGSYFIDAFIGVENYKLGGNWQVHFENDDDSGYWYINNVQIQGIKF